MRALEGCDVRSLFRDNYDGRSVAIVVLRWVRALFRKVRVLLNLL